MANTSDELIEQIIELGNGNIDDQLQACKMLSKANFKIISNTAKLLPEILKLLKSEDFRVQKNGLYYLSVISQKEEYVQFFVEADGIKILVDLFSSGNRDIQKQCLKCLSNISLFRPIEVANTKPTLLLLQFIKGNNQQLSLTAACILKTLSNEKQNIDGIVNEGALESLINVLNNSKNNDLIKEGIIILTNIVGCDLQKCRQVLNYGTLELVKKHFLHPVLKSFVLDFLQSILYTEEEIDEVIDKCLILLIIKELNSRGVAEIKLKAVNIIKVIIEKKPAYIQTLINNDILELISDQLDSDHIELLISSLLTINLIVVSTACCYPFNENLEEKLQKLRDHENCEIKGHADSILNSILEKHLRHQATVNNIKAEKKDEEDEAYDQVDQRQRLNIQHEISAEKSDASLTNDDYQDELNAIFDILKKKFTKAAAFESSVLPQLLPKMVELFCSKNKTIQTIAKHLFMEINIPSTDDDSADDASAKAIFKENMNVFAGNGGITTILLNLLSSSNTTDVHLMISLIEYFHILDVCVSEVVHSDTLERFFDCLNDDQNKIFSRAGVKLLNYISKNEANIPLIVNYFKKLIKLFKLFDGVRDYVMETLLNIVNCNFDFCQKVVKEGAISLIQGYINSDYFNNLLVMKINEGITKYGEELIDILENAGCFCIIVKTLNNEEDIDDETKISIVGILENILSNKPKQFLIKFIPKNVISFLLKNFHINTQLTIVSLTLLHKIIIGFGFDVLDQTLENIKSNVQNLLNNENFEIQQLAAMIIKEGSEARKIVKLETSDMADDENDDQPVIGNERKRLLDDENSDELQRNKRRKVSTNHNASMNDSEDDGYDDPGEHSMDSTEQSNDDVKPYPLHPPPQILLTLPEDEPTPEFGDIPQNNSNFDSFKYYTPSEAFTDSCCEKLGLDFDRTKYFQLYSNVKMKQITSMSMPAATLPAIGKSGFGCFSLFLTGEENHAEKIREEIIKYFMDLNKNEILDEEKEAEIRGNSMTNEHLRTIATWWNCKILVYFDDFWQLFGNWEDKAAPVFILQKEIVDDKISYEIVTSLFD